MWQVIRSTWTGRILLLNSIVFLMMAWQSQSIFMPDPDVLIAWGAKDPARLIAGEYWRFVTPMFVHIGILHFAFNSWALWVVGRQIEQLLGPGPFLAVYILSGIAGVMSSALWSLSLSAGASGAIFGLLGCGFYVERKMKQAYERRTGYKIRGGAYASMLFANLIFGLLVPQIDNAAHVGGMIAGFVLIYITVQLKISKTYPAAKIKAALASVILAAFLALGMWLSTSSSYVLGRVWRELDKLHDDPYGTLQVATLGINIESQDLRSRMSRAEILFQAGEDLDAVKDLEAVKDQAEFEKEAYQMAERLRGNGFKRQSDLVGRYGVRD